MTLINVPLVQDFKAGKDATGAANAARSYLENIAVEKDSVTGKYYLTKRSGFQYHRYDASSTGFGIYYWENPAVSNLVTVEYDGTNYASFYGATSRTKIGNLTNNLDTTGKSRIDFAETDDPYLVIHAHNNTGTENLYYINSSWTQTRLTNATNGYPSATLAAGVVYLDEYVFVLGRDKKVYNSNLSDITTWTSTDFITAGRVQDVGMYICKHNDNIAVFGTKSIEFFYDAGNPNGSPLAPRSDVFYNTGLSTSSTIGGYAAISITSNDEIAAFIGTSTQGTQHTHEVYLLQNFQLKKISTTDISWYLADESTLRIIKDFKGDPYILLVSAGGSFAYDINSGIWVKWTYTSSQSSWDIVDAHGEYVITETDASVHYMGDVIQDTDHAGSTNFVATIILDPWDGGTLNNKYCRSTTLVGDEAWNDSNTISIQWQNDKLEAYTTARDIPLVSFQPLYRCGVFRKRKFKLIHNTGYNFRLESIELDIDGSVSTRDE